MADRPTDEETASATSPKKPYRAPALLEWGTLRDITLNNGWNGNSDGAKKGSSRTR